MTKTKVAILYGGRSVEHGVSINSARNIFEFIDKDRFEPIPIGISQTGEWFLTEHINKDITGGHPLSIVLNPARPHFVTTAGSTIHADVVFPVLHGTDGEDGSIQGLLKAMDLPMIGTGVLGSSMSINKLVAKKMLQEAGLPVADFMYQYFGEPNFNFSEIKRRMGLPFMVKAANLGSSVGVSKVNNEEEFVSALEDSFKYDDCVLFERFIKAREIECAVLGNAPPEASLPGEIVISDRYDFYTFDAKYVDPEAVTIKVPAELDEASSAKIRELSVKAYQALHCNDFARVDLFLTDSGDVFVNEINTIPGFTNSSMFPMMWKERGITFTALISKLVDFSLERFKKSKRVQTGFTSNLKF